MIEILPEFVSGLTDIEGFSHLYVIWEFDRSEGFERPNPIALTVVELLRRDGVNLHVRGLDMLDGTPILDIKPYDAAAEAVPDEIYLCTFDELFEGLSQPERNRQFALLTTLVQKLGYQIASGRDPNFHEMWALSPRAMNEPRAHLRTFQPNVPEPPPPTSAQEFERRFLAWVHLAIRVLPMRRTEPDEGWTLQLPHSKVNFSVLDANARAARQNGDQWVLRVREHEPAAFIQRVESHFAPGSAERRQMADGAVLAQFRSSQLRHVFEDQTDRT